MGVSGNWRGLLSAISAILLLERKVEEQFHCGRNRRTAHSRCDLQHWNLASQPGRPRPTWSVRHRTVEAPGSLRLSCILEGIRAPEARALTPPRLRPISYKSLGSEALISAAERPVPGTPPRNSDQSGRSSLVVERSESLNSRGWLLLTLDRPA